MTTESRIINALKLGWGFSNLHFNPIMSQRHSLWVRRPGNDGWECNKVVASMSEEDYVEHLLDEAGVPK